MRDLIKFQSFNPQKIVPEHHEGAYDTLLKAGCPPENALKAAQVIAKDDFFLLNKGRTLEEQEIIDKTFPYLQKKV